MSITPAEIRHTRLRRGLLGYARRPTEELLARAVAGFESAWRTRADREEEVERLEAELGRHREVERLLRDTLVSAERAADDLRVQGRREYDLLLNEARLKARELVAEAEAERDRLRTEVRRLRAARSELRVEYRAFLQAALERLDDDPAQGGELEDTGELRVPGQAA